MKPLKDKKKTTIGLALSGGGIRGVAHIGLLKVLEELDIHPTHISGTSAGALIGGLHAAGCTAEQILDIFKTRSPFKFSHFSFYKPGLMDTDKFGEYIFEELLPHRRFEDLDKKLFVTATNISDATSMTFSEGDDLMKALLASCALPMIYSPIEIDGKFYVDGGILNNFPTEPLMGQCDVILGSYVSPVKSVLPEEINSSLKVMMRVFDISSAYCKDKFRTCDWVFNPSGLHEFGMFDRKQVDNIYELGYQTAWAQREVLEELFAEPAEIIEEKPMPVLVPKNSFFRYVSDKLPFLSAR